MQAAVRVFVFSFNRGVFLRHCLASIETCLPGVGVCIIDDNSTDPDTRAALSEMGTRHRVERNDDPTRVEFKTGGLAGSMNRAMAIAADEGVELAIFIQDDMQMVRRVDQADLARWAAYFAAVPNAIQLSTSFVRRASSARFLQAHAVARSAGAYLRHREAEGGKSNFSDTGVFSVSRFGDLFGTFEAGEGRNSDKARALGLVCGRSFHPFQCWLPYPLSFRGRARSLRHRVFETLGRSGFHPIRIMTEDESTRFLTRDPRHLPIMEDYLVAPDAPRHDRWSTGGGEYNFLAYDGAAARVYRWMRSLRRGLREGRRS